MTGYEDARAILLDETHFTSESAQSPIVRSLGVQMLNIDGTEHARLRAAFAPVFTPACVRTNLEEPIRAAARDLISTFEGRDGVDVRVAFAARLPVWAILRMCGLPLDAESRMRRWYDAFGESLANFLGDEPTFQRATHAVTELHNFLDVALDKATAEPGTSLLHTLLSAPAEGRLTRDEMKANLSILFFGGISTVEALILNTLWALFEHPNVLRRVQNDVSHLASVVEETVRWHSPVQSGTRFVRNDLEWKGHQFLAGETVSCMLGAANRDARVFVDPDRFDPDRPNVRRHLGFAAGPHACLGFHVARLEARIALEELLARFPKLRLVPEASGPPCGAEFHQPLQLTVAWT